MKKIDKVTDLRKPKQNLWHLVIVNKILNNKPHVPKNGNQGIQKEEAGHF